MTTNFARRLAAGFGFLAVVFGAFGAHAMHFEPGSSLETMWKTAGLYHLAHAIVLLVLSTRPVVARGPVWCFTAGICLFSGGLYGFVFLLSKWLMFLVPLGGLSLLAGWLWLALARE